MSERKIYRKLLKLFGYSIWKRKWYLPNIPEITVDDLYIHTKSKSPPIIIDTRSQSEYEGTDTSFGQGHIPSALSIPLLRLSSNILNLQPFDDNLVVTYCPGGGMSMVAVEILKEAGFRDVRSLRGGIELWDQKGYPTTKTSTNHHALTGRPPADNDILASKTMSLLAKRPDPKTTILNILKNNSEATTQEILEAAFKISKHCKDRIPVTLKRLEKEQLLVKRISKEKRAIVWSLA